jgi:hypothetical protein
MLLPHLQTGTVPRAGGRDGRDGAGENDTTELRLRRRRHGCGCASVRVGCRRASEALALIRRTLRYSCRLVEMSCRISSSKNSRSYMISTIVKKVGI